jgi:hypothetical protein
MRTLNRFGEQIYIVHFDDRAAAWRWAKCVSAQPRLFSILGVRPEGGGWAVRYRARKTSPWAPDPRATWPRRA